jgi:hypothetical protein
VTVSVTMASGGITHVDRSGLLGRLGLFAGPTAELGVGSLSLLERRLEEVGVCRVGSARRLNVLREGAATG